jgi:hypothetical protein
MATITKALQATLTKYPNLKKVYFTENGSAHFQAYELAVVKGSSETALFTHGVFSHKQTIPGSEAHVDGGIKEDIAYGLPETKVVKTMSRKEVLEANPVDADKSVISDILSNATPDELAKLKALLNAGDNTEKPKK